MIRILSAVALSCLFAVTSCTTEEQPSAPATPPAEATPPADATPPATQPSGGNGGMAAAATASPALTAKLAAADAADGTSDQVVTKCAGCKLGMNGKSEHAMTLAGYELHLCSAACKERFGTDTEAKVLALVVED